MKTNKKWIYEKTVIISGASGGIGFAVSKLLIEKYNCKIIGIARNEQKLLRNLQTLGDKKGNFTYRLFDVSQKNNWADFSKWLQENAITPDVLINNAGFMLPFKKFGDVPDSDIDEIIKTNLCSCVYSAKTLIPLLKKSTTPAIVNVSSAAGMCPVVGESMYCLTKYGVRGFTETLRQDYKNQIYVCGVHPGFIKTNLMDRMEISKKNNGIIDKIMMPVEKASKKIVKGIVKKKKRIVMGFDGRFMTFMYKLMPKTTPSLIRKIFKISKLEMFNDLFND